MTQYQGLFTSGPSIDDLLAKRDANALDLQRQLMKGAAQGARDPAKAQAVSFLGSSIGRALGASMNGGRDAEMEKREAQLAAQSKAQQGYLGAAAGNSRAMYEQVELLQQSYPAAAVKMLALAKAEEAKELKAIADENASLTTAAEKKAALALAAEIRQENVEAEQAKLDLAATHRIEDQAEVLRAEGVEASQALAQAAAEEAKN